MDRITLFICFSLATFNNAFTIPCRKAFLAKPAEFHTALQGAEKHSDGPKEEVVQKEAFAKGTLVQFSEKSRVHIGQIKSLEHKSNGCARYDVKDIDGKLFNVADKQVIYAMPAPPNAETTQKLMQDFAAAEEASEKTLRKKLDVSPELLEMAWEEAEEEDSHGLTPKKFIDLIHSHKASPVEAFLAWRLLRTDLAHIFFKEIKQNGRVVSFKAKARKAVEAAKQAFCSKTEHQDEDEICFAIRSDTSNVDAQPTLNFAYNSTK